MRRETRLGGVLANVLSVATRGLGIFLWYLLRFIYRTDWRVFMLRLGLVVAVAALLWLVLR